MNRMGIAILSAGLIAGSFARAADKSAPASKPAVWRYVKSTPQQDAAAIAQARNVSADVAKELDITLAEFQTAHFIVFTDWDPREYSFLKTNLEGAYAAVARQFQISVKENIFIGKLPVFMFANYDEFAKYGSQYDDAPVSRALRGYFAQARDGTGHMAMWKPVAEGMNLTREQAERDWAYTLTHEFTHAFISRYRSNAPIPRWMNEGLAEIVAQRQFPSVDRRQLMRRMALVTANPAGNGGMTMAQIFDDEQMPGGEWYPAMQGLVETLIAQDRSKFIKLFNAIKDGQPPEAAMKQIYGWDYDALEKAFREYTARG